MRRVVARPEEKPLKQLASGGVGKEVAADATKLGRDRKNAVGRLSFNKGYAQFFGGRGGGVIIDIFTNPGGVGNLSQVKEVLGGNFAAGAILHTDRERAYVAYVRDNPQPDLAHCRVNRPRAEKEGFVWKPNIDWENGPEFAGSEAADTIMAASTQVAYGYIANLKQQLSVRGGVQRTHLRGYLERKQRRSDWGSEKDLYVASGKRYLNRNSDHDERLEVH